jgi:hypothetical protein
VDGDGNPNALGKKYERLLALNTAAKLQLPPPGAQGYTKACEAFDKREIESVIAGIFGFDELRRLADSMPAESLSALLVRQLLELDPHISYVARAAFLKIHGSIDL